MPDSFDRPFDAFCLLPSVHATLTALFRLYESRTRSCNTLIVTGNKDLEKLSLYSVCVIMLSPVAGSLYCDHHASERIIHHLASVLTLGSVMRRMATVRLFTADVMINWFLASLSRPLNFVDSPPYLEMYAVAR